MGVDTLMWDEVFTKISDARERLWVLQTWLPSLRINKERWATALSQGARARVLLIDQTLVQYRLKSRELPEGLLSPNAADLGRLARRFNQNGATMIEGRFYSVIPLGPTYIIDDDVYFGLFFAHIDSMAGEAFHVSASSALGERLIASFQKTWETGHHSSGELRLPTPDVPPISDEIQLEARVHDLAEGLKGSLVQLATGDLDHYPAQRGLVLFARHGHTDLSECNVFLGNLEVNLNHHGKKAAQRLARTVSKRRWDVLYSSPLKRAMDTISIALGGRHDDVIQRFELVERWMGAVESLSKTDYLLSRPDETPRLAEGGLLSRSDKGESYADVFLRLYPLLKRIIELVREDRNVLVVTHEGPMRMIEWALNDFMDLERALRLPVPYADPVLFGVVPVSTQGQLMQRGVLMTDVERSGRWFAELGDELGTELLHHHHQIALGAVRANGGKVHKKIGDAILASFSGAESVVKSALDVQRINLDEPFRADGQAYPVQLRVGAHFGEVEVREGDIYGETVNKTKRLVDAAEAGGILISEQLFELVAGLSLVHARRPDVDLKEFGATDVVDIGWHG